MNKLVEIKLVVDSNESEEARQALFRAAKDLGYNVLSSDERLLTTAEVKEAKIQGLID